jgi:hypothetical protein
MTQPILHLRCNLWQPPRHRDSASRNVQLALPGYSLQHWADPTLLAAIRASLEQHHPGWFLDGYMPDPEHYPDIEPPLPYHAVEPNE